jgi:predicted Zn-dependent protease
VEIIPAPDLHFFNAAAGWLELGNCVEARAELAHLSATYRQHPAVLELEWSVGAAEQNWEAAFTAARALVAALPEEPAGWLHRAYACRRMAGGGLKQAQTLLRPAADKFPQEPMILFNLACYACQLEELPAARDWLRRAEAIGGKKAIVAMALADEDLKPLWPELRGGKA